MAVQLYRPANGSEGADFVARWCHRCAHDVEGGCTIQNDATFYRLTDPEYPAAWRADGPSGPRCTTFEPEDPYNQPFDPAAAVGMLL